ncbi:unnamed protein product [Tilletia laevis]|nr:hypothetical protein CF328_g6516 [Tilletia controversa]CAD6966497.1 unnamed protein product [Tilletia laevis]
MSFLTRTEKRTIRLRDELGASVLSGTTVQGGGGGGSRRKRRTVVPEVGPPILLGQTPRDIRTVDEAGEDLRERRLAAEGPNGPTATKQREVEEARRLAQKRRETAMMERKERKAFPTGASTTNHAAWSKYEKLFKVNASAPGESAAGGAGRRRKQNGKGKVQGPEGAKERTAENEGPSKRSRLA